MILPSPTFAYNGLLLVILSFSLSSISFTPSVNGQTTSPYPTVQTDTFAVQGQYYPVNQTVVSMIGLPTTNITMAEFYYGVPYGEPPVGSLRLEKPVPIAPYTTPYNGTTPQNFPLCHTDLDTAYTIPISEDCLRLGIARPAGTTAGAQLPVVVYLFGGGYLSGGASQVIPPWMSGPPDLLVSQGVIFVAVQYRQAILGFGSDGTSQLPGNYGLFDQQLALQWVAENIGAFGGDNSSITLWGSSAGAASTSYHTIQPNSSQYFQRAYQDSGSMNDPWSSGSRNRSISTTVAVAALVNCTDPTTLKACLQAVDMATLQTAVQGYPTAAYPGYSLNAEMFGFGPIYDGDFFYTDLGTMIVDAPPMPNVFGFATDEGAKFLPIIAAGVPNFTLSGINFTIADFSTLVNASVLPSDYSNAEAVGQIDDIRAELLNFYANEDSQQNATEPYFYYMQMIRLLSDIEFIIGELWEARRKAQLGWPVNVYHWDFCNSQQWESALYSRVYPSLYPYPVCQHCSMYPYQISSQPDLSYPASYWNRTTTDFQIQNYLVRALLSFINSGQPNSQWPMASYTGLACNGSSEYTAMNINVPEPSLEDGSAENAIRLGFWDGLCAQFDCRLVLGFPKTMGQCIPPSS